MPNYRGQGLSISPFDPQGQTDKTVQSSYAGTPDQASQAVAGVASSLAARVGALGDQLASREGEKAGTMAGMKGDFRPTGGFTIRDQAYDKAATGVYLSTLSARFSQDAMNIFEANKDNPAGFQKAYDGLVQSYQKDHVFPEIQAPFTDNAMRLGGSLQRQALTGWQQKDRDQKHAALLGNMNERDAASQRLLAVDPHDQVAEQTLMRLRDEDVADVRAQVESGAITAVQGETMVEKIKNDAQQKLVLARANTLKSADEIDAYRQRVKTDFAGGKLDGLTDWDTLDAHLSTLSKSRRIEGDKALKDLNGELDDMLQRQGAGLDNASEWAALEAKGKTLGAAGIAAVDQARDKQKIRRKIASLAPDEADKFLQDLEATAKGGAPASELRGFLRDGKGAESVDRLAPGFSSGLGAMFSAMPADIRAQVKIGSGWRSYTEQEKIWNDALKKYGSAEEARKWAAPPGNSNHNKGLAADLAFGSDAARQWVHDNADQFGLHFRLQNEDWHIEPKDMAAAGVAPGGAIGGAGAFATGYSPQAAGDKMEGGYAAATAGPDGQALVRTLDDVRAGKSSYVTLAGDPAFYGRTYTIPTVTYQSGGQTYTLTNVRGVVHDTGAAFKGAPEGRFDVALGKDLAPAERQQSMANVQFLPGQRGPSAYAASVISDARKFAGDRQRLVSADPLLAASRDGIVADITPVDFAAAPDVLGTQFRQRVAQADAVAAAYRRAPVYLRPDEKEVLKGRVGQGGEEALSAIGGLIAGAGTKAPAVLKEIDDTAPALAHAASVAKATGDMSFARQVAQAQKVRHDGGKLPSPDGVALDTAYRAVVGQSLAGLDPAEEARTRQAALDWATVEISRRGLDPKVDVNEVAPIMQMAVQKARGQTGSGAETFGGIATLPLGAAGRFYGRNDLSVQVPASVRSDKFGAVLEAITDDDLKALPDPPVDNKGKILTAEALRRNSPMFGPGGYRFGTFDPATGVTAPIASKSGGAFLLPFGALEPALRQRVPSAFR